jgi:hypothetical protein
MTASAEADVAADLAEATVREANDLLEVAASGTLEQRRLAVQNSAALVAQARALSDRAGTARYRLEAAVDKAERDWSLACTTVVEDLEAAGREQLAREVELFSSNVYNPVQVDEDMERGRTMTTGAQAGGNWFFNAEEAQGAELQGLKERLNEGIESTVNVVVPQLGTTVEQGLQRQQVALLNDLLQTEQRRNRQVGAAIRSSEEAEVTRGFDAQWRSLLGRFAGEDGGEAARFSLPQAQTAARHVPGGAETGLIALGDNPSYGVFFNDGQDGHIAARVENLFDQALGDVNRGIDAGGGGGAAFQSRSGYFGGDNFEFQPPNFELQPGRAAVPVLRRGLMGVDVTLPRQGRVFHFRSLKSGAPIVLSASAPGMPGVLRWLALVLGVGLVGWLAVRWWR